MQGSTKLQPYLHQGQCSSRRITARLLRQSAGFTLIELLLVITLIAIITSLAIMQHQRSTIINKVDKASIEVQSMMQAALTHYTQQGRWPDNNSDLAQCSMQAANISSVFIKEYVPNRNTQSTFGSYYCWGQESGAHTFWLAMQIPHNDRHILQLLLAQLPNAMATSDPTQSTTQMPCTDEQPCYIKVAVVEANTTSGQGGSYVAGVGYCIPQSASSQGSNEDVSCVRDPQQADTYYVTLSCPAQQRPHIYFTPNFLTNARPTRKYGVLAIPNKISSVLSNDPNNDCTALDAQRYRCKIQVDAIVDSRPFKVVNPRRTQDYAPGSIGASYIALCQMTKKPVLQKSYLNY